MFDGMMGKIENVVCGCYCLIFDVVIDKLGIWWIGIVIIMVLGMFMFNGEFWVVGCVWCGGGGGVGVGVFGVFGMGGVGGLVVFVVGNFLCLVIDLSYVVVIVDVILVGVIDFVLIES